MDGGDFRPTVLVIDDEPTIRKSVSRLLERAGYRVRTAGTGDEAMALVRGDLTGDGVEELVERSRVPPVSKPFTAADLLLAVGAICPAPSPAADSRKAAS